MNRKQKEFQLIITGLRLKQNHKQILDFVNSTLKIKNWIDVEGNVGHIGNTTLTNVEVKHELKIISEAFPEIEIGITYMSGPSGSYNSILDAYKITKGKILKTINPHAGHPAPRKIVSAPLDNKKPVFITPKEESKK